MSKIFKDKNIKFMSSGIGNDKLLEKYKTIWTKIKDTQNIKLNCLLFYDHRYVKTNIRTYGNRFYTNFCGLNVPEDSVGCESFTINCFDSLLVYENKY